MSYNEIDDLGRVQNLLEAGVGKVFPIKVEKRDPFVHQVLWGVREPMLQVYSITAVRVLSWLLKVKDSRYSLPNMNIPRNNLLDELLYYVVLFNNSVREPLRSNEMVCDPV